MNNSIVKIDGEKFALSKDYEPETVISCKEACEAKSVCNKKNSKLWICRDASCKVYRKVK